MSRLPNWLRAGVVTGTFVALPTFLTTLIGWANDLAAYATDPTLPPPDLSIVRGAVVSLALGAVTGGLNAAYRWAQERSGKGLPPVYPSIVKPPDASANLHRDE